MFQSKGFFARVHCPLKENCMLPRCIFLHPSTKDQTIPSTATSVPLATDDDQHGPRKRRKVEIQSDVKAVPRASLETSTSAVVRAQPEKRKTSSLHRDISPPPLRKKTQDERHATAPVKAKVETKIPVRAPIKQEALNPRALKKGAPATHDMRFRLLRALHEQFVRLNSELEKEATSEEKKLVLSSQELITKALDIEENATASSSIYSNVVKNNILSYKRMKVAQWKDERQKEAARENTSQTTTQADKPSAKPLSPPKPIETGLSTQEEINLLPRLRTPTDFLSPHIYVNSVPTDADIDVAKKGIEANKGWEVCDRCKVRFQVFPERREEDGAFASGGSCTYHFGKPYWTERSATDPSSKREKRYRCCSQAVGDSPGCTKADSHVFKISEVKRLAAVLNFIETPPNTNAPPNRPVCIDGEMGYTVYGLELIRLTATSWPSGDELLDVLVKPLGGILDLNTRYSGVSAAEMASAMPHDAPPDPTNKSIRIVSSPAAARDLLLRYLSPQTPLIGHGLENDLNAIRLIHPTIVDTALLYPHKAGLPYRHALKTLTETHLHRRIQMTQNVDGKIIGHDSKEDANAAGDLVRFKVGEEWARMKRDGWTLMGGAFLPPTPKTQPVLPFDDVPRGPGLSVRELERDATAAPVRVLSGKSAGQKRSREESELENKDLR